MKKSIISVLCFLSILVIGCKKEFDSTLIQDENKLPNKSALNSNGEPWEEMILEEKLENAY